MVRKHLLGLLLSVLALPLLTSRGDAAAAFAPQKGFVLVRTLQEGGGPAPFVSFQIEKLQGNYPLPPGPFVTNSVGQLWVALYPGVYRFSVPVRGASPTYWDVNVGSLGEYYIWFLVPGAPV